jgi:hypothetical protein
MPKQYEEIRDSYVRRGKSLKEAKSIAAATYNKQHPGHPMKPHKKRKGFVMPRKDKHGYY